MPQNCPSVAIISGQTVGAPPPRPTAQELTKAQWRTPSTLEALLSCRKDRARTHPPDPGLWGCAPDLPTVAPRGGVWVSGGQSRVPGWTGAQPHRLLHTSPLTMTGCT